MTWIQIIDDDHWCGEAIIAFMIDQVPEARYETKTTPEPDDGRDIYIVDNEFEDGDHGVEIIRTIRRRNPDATIVMCTATRDRVNAQEAMNAGCNAMVEKGSARGREQMREVIRRHIESRCIAVEGPVWRSVLADVKSIINAWNTRMTQEDAKAVGFAG